MHLWRTIRSSHGGSDSSVKTINTFQVFSCKADPYLVLLTVVLVYESKYTAFDHNQDLQTVPMELGFPMEGIHGSDVQWPRYSQPPIKIYKYLFLKLSFSL